MGCIMGVYVGSIIGFYEAYRIMVYVGCACAVSVVI